MAACDRVLQQLYQSCARFRHAQQGLWNRPSRNRIWTNAARFYFGECQGNATQLTGLLRGPRSSRCRYPSESLHAKKRSGEVAEAGCHGVPTKSGRHAVVDRPSWSVVRQLSHSSACPAGCRREGTAPGPASYLENTGILPRLHPGNSNVREVTVPRPKPDAALLRSAKSIARFEDRFCTVADVH